MRFALAFAVFCSALSSTAFAGEPAASPTAAERPADALDTVLLNDGSVLRGVITSSDASGVTLRLRSGEERAVARRDIRMVSGWAIHEAPSPAVSEQSAPAPIAPGHWYGWQTLASDGGAILFGVLGAAATSHDNKALPGTLFTLSAATYLFGAPLIHGIGHGNPGRGAASIALRLAAPLAMGTVGFLIGIPADTQCSHSNGVDDVCLNSVGGAFIGLGVGVVAAMAIDAAVFAREPAEDDPRKLTLVPLIIPKGSASQPRGASGLAVTARF